MMETAGRQFEQLIGQLLAKGEVALPAHHPLLLKHTSMELFNILHERLNTLAGGNDLDLGMHALEDGWQISALLGSVKCEGAI